MYLIINAIQHENCRGHKENKIKKEFRMKSCLGQENTSLSLETFLSVFLNSSPILCKALSSDLNN